MTDLCPDSDLATIVEMISTDPAQAMASLEQLIEQHSGDPRLHFLQGSLLAGERRYEAAREAMEAAVAIAPGFELARYQLGFLLFTMADVSAAFAAWAPFATAPEESPFRWFITGFQHLADDQFDPAIASFREGIQRNTDNPVVNGDIERIIAGVEALAVDTVAGDSSEEPTSATQLMLMRFGADTKH